MQLHNYVFIGILNIFSFVQFNSVDDLFYRLFQPIFWQLNTLAIDDSAFEFVGHPHN